MSIKKNVFITGTSRGLGLEIAKNFLEKGWVVYGASRSLGFEIKNNDFYQLNLDLRDEKSIKSIIKKLNGLKFDLLINNASIFHQNKLIDTQDSLIRDLISTNILGTILITKALLGSLNLNSKIIFINSVAGSSEIHL